jgi:hypothetical protein
VLCIPKIWVSKSKDSTESICSHSFTSEAENCMQKIQSMNRGMVVVGIWVASAPYTLGYSSVTAAIWTDLIAGVAVAVLAAASALTLNEASIRAMCWITAGLGLWLILAPLILGYSMVSAALWSDLIAGVLILALSLWAERELPQGVRHTN